MEYSISQLANDFQISTRTLRYYEELGLLRPTRNKAGQRLYSRKDLVRLKLILRGKKYGFQLDEIKEMILLFDQDRSGRKQLRRTIRFGEEKIRMVNDRIEELVLMKQEMEAIMDDFKKRLETE
ncbi:MerR family transcriptional regulator [Falsibacillus albus]|uniref:MerR family DNA-binding transcriptional regulator n=1 Tax=Falsibacillus albus TaxID=2478915 RepID=A0A3L7JVE3_9BACI|nr:MerR family DNA-binding transcriptional regulator [Falsibacillus albus]RLQ94089.1 MerR family DNA-binding transcriptional regulator [Falsibacillus albus]